jgi:hypothetical protein
MGAILLRQDMLGGVERVRETFCTLKGSLESAMIAKEPSTLSHAPDILLLSSKTSADLFSSPRGKGEKLSVSVKKAEAAPIEYWDESFKFDLQSLKGPLPPQGGPSASLFGRRSFQRETQLVDEFGFLVLQEQNRQDEEAEAESEEEMHRKASSLCVPLAKCSKYIREWESMSEDRKKKVTSPTWSDSQRTSNDSDSGENGVARRNPKLNPRRSLEPYPRSCQIGRHVNIALLHIGWLARESFQSINLRNQSIENKEIPLFDVSQSILAHHVLFNEPQSYG